MFRSHPLLGTFRQRVVRTSRDIHKWTLMDIHNSESRSVRRLSYESHTWSVKSTNDYLIYLRRPPLRRHRCARSSLLFHSEQRTRITSTGVQKSRDYVHRYAFISVSIVYVSCVCRRGEAPIYVVPIILWRQIISALLLPSIFCFGFIKALTI